MSKVLRSDIDENWAHSGIVEAGNFVFINYCAGNVNKMIEEQVSGAIDHLSARLESIDLTLDDVVQVMAMFKDIWDIPSIEKVFKERFNGKYPARKSIQTAFAHEGLMFQLDAIAYRP